MKITLSTLTNPDSIDVLYVLVRFPLVQELMAHDWFHKECFLYQAHDGQEYLSSAYFVPISRIMAIKQPE